MSGWNDSAWKAGLTAALLGAMHVRPGAKKQFVTQHGTSVEGARKILADRSLLMPSLATQRRDSATLNAVTFLTKQPELLPARRLTFTSDARTAIMPELRERLLVHPSEESALESLALKDYLSSLAMGDKEARRRGIGALVPPGGEQAARMALPIDPGRGWYTETKVYDRIPIRDTVLLVDRDSTSASRARNNYEARQRLRALGVDPGNPPPLSARRKAQTELIQEARKAGLTVIPFGKSEQVKTAIDALDASGMSHEDAKGGETDDDLEGFMSELPPDDDLGGFMSELGTDDLEDFILDNNQ